MNVSASKWIERLNLAPHPEGGYYREIYRSNETIPAAALPARFGADRSCCTSIYYLLERGNFSAFHRMKQDEIWHLYSGGPLMLYRLNADKTCTTIRMACDLTDDSVPQAIVPGGCWFGAEPSGQAEFALVGCTVSPGFDFADFELARAESLVEEYPSCRALIHRLTRS